MRKMSLVRFLLVGLMVLPMALFAGCEIKKTQEGELPDVDVDVEGGQLPKYDVDPAEVEVGIEKKPVTVPDIDVDVDRKQVNIPVPDVNITPGNDEDDSVEVAPNAE